MVLVKIIREKHMRKFIHKCLSVIVGVLLVSTVNAENLTTSMKVGTTLTGSCTASVQNIDFGTIVISQSVIIDDKFTLRCSKGIVAKIGFIGDHNDPEYPARRFMIGAKPGNTDKIVYRLGRRAAFFTTDGATPQGQLGEYTGTGETTNWNVVSGLQLTVIGAFIDNVFQMGDFKVKADNYVSNLTLVLTY